MKEATNTNTAVNPIDEANTSNQPMYKEYCGFLFLPSYRESYDCLVNAGEKEAANLLLRAIVSYGSEGAIITDDPRVEVVMTSIRRTIDNQRKKYKEKKDQEQTVEEKEMLSKVISLQRQLEREKTKNHLKQLEQWG